MDNIKKNEPDEISVRELVSKFKSGLRYIKSKWIISVVFGIAGLLIGIAYSIIKKPQYTATSTFVLEETGGGSGLGQYASLASLAGIDIGGASEKGLFQGENILKLYESRLMIQKTLLTPVVINGKKQLLIDRFIDSYHLLKRWKDNDDVDNVNFNGDPSKFNRTQDSLLRELIKDFNKKVLTVTKSDKKLSIISVEVKSKDELFSKLFDEVLVQTVNDFYVQTRTKKTLQNVRVLQHQADSVRAMLNSSLGSVAASKEANPNANPALVSLQVPSQRRQIDVQANSSIYAEVVKNLELSKVSLRQETPLIQLIDQPIIPLDDDKVKPVTGAILGLVLGLFFSLVYIVVARFYVFVRNA